MLGCRDAPPRWPRRSGAARSSLSSVPLYRLVKQEYIPSDVDEAEFEVNVNAPEGTSLAAMDEAMRAIEDELRQMPGVRTGAGDRRAAASSAASTRAAPTCASRRTRSASSRSRRFLDGAGAARSRWRRSSGNYTPARRDARGAQAPAQVQATCAASVRNVPSFNIGGGNFDIDFAMRGPDLEALVRLRRTSCASRSTELGGIVDADTTLKLDKPELRVEIDRERAADLGVADRRTSPPRCG